MRKEKVQGEKKEKNRKNYKKEVKKTEENIRRRFSTFYQGLLSNKR